MPDERKTVEIGGEVLASLAQQSTPDADNFDSLNEWEGEVASGTPQRDATPAVSRTSTRYDPLTTAVLAATTREDD